MGQLVFQAALGGQVNLVGPNTASTFNLNVPAASDTLVGEATTNTLTNKTLASPAITGAASFAAGAVGSPSITTTGDTNPGIFFPAADTIAFAEGGAEAMRIDSSGNVGIGTSSPAQKLQVLAVNGTGFVGAAIQNNNSNVGIAGVQFSSDATYFKAAIGLLRSNANGVGSLVFYNDSNTDAADWATTDEKMRIDSSGNVGIGSTSPTSVFSNYKSLYLNGSSGSAIQMQYGGSLASNIVADGNALYLQNITAITFNTGGTGTGTERARIDSSGNLLVGTTSTSVTSGGYNFLINDGGTGYATGYIGHITGCPSGYAYLNFKYAGTTIGTITQNGTTGVLYNLTSDYRLKDNQQPLTGAKDFVMALQPKKWQWWDGSGEGVGFIAHEFMEVAKYSGNGKKDAVDSDGKPVYQSIQPSSSEVMANLVSFIQEQQALIQSLTTRITALEAK
jgi:hypothetical protein